MARLVWNYLTLFFGGCYSVLVFASESVTILELDWSSQQVTSRITGLVLQQKGVSVRYLKTEAKGQWFLLNTGEADLQIEVWEGTMATQFNLLVSQGRILDAGEHHAKTREEWWFPDYVKNLCPRLPDWQALKGCSHLFSREQASDKGVYYTGPWEKPDRARVRALGLNFEVIELADSTALNRKIEEYVKMQTPLLIFNWTPNWVEAKYQGEFVEFPDYHPDCETDPNWGINPDYPWDCGNPKNGWLKKAVSNRLVKLAPCAAKIIQAITFTADDLAQAALQVDIEGQTAEQSATHWINNNRSRWQVWLNACDTL